MTFPEAIKKVLEGKRITKLDWSTKEIYGELKDEILKLKRDGVYHQWIVSRGDMIGEDWIVLEDEPMN